MQQHIRHWKRKQGFFSLSCCCFYHSHHGPTVTESSNGQLVGDEFFWLQPCLWLSFSSFILRTWRTQFLGGTTGSHILGPKETSQLQEQNQVCSWNPPSHVASQTAVGRINLAPAEPDLSAFQDCCFYRLTAASVHS